MANPSMNNPGTEQDRTIDVMGFDNVAQYTSKTAVHMSTVPYEVPKMVLVTAVEHSNTDKIAFPPETQDLAKKGM